MAKLKLSITIIRQFRTCAIWAVGDHWTVFADNKPIKNLFSSHHYPACVQFAEQHDAIAHPMHGTTIHRMGINVRIYRHARRDWRIIVGAIVYAGYASRNDAINGLDQIIGKEK